MMLFEDGCHFKICSNIHLTFFYHLPPKKTDKMAANMNPWLQASTDSHFLIPDNRQQVEQAGKRHHRIDWWKQQLSVKKTTERNPNLRLSLLQNVMLEQRKIQIRTYLVTISNEESLAGTISPHFLALFVARKQQNQISSKKTCILSISFPFFTTALYR